MNKFEPAKTGSTMDFDDAFGCMLYTYVAAAFLAGASVVVAIYWLISRVSGH